VDDSTIMTGDEVTAPYKNIFIIISQPENMHSQHTSHTLIYNDDSEKKFK